MESGVKEGNCNFARVGGGRSHFARVRIFVSKELFPEPELQNQAPREWLNAAEVGAANALELLKKPKWHFQIKELLGLDVDTSPNTVWCAAFLAVFNAFAVKDVQVSFSEQKEGWLIHWQGITISYRR